MLIQEEDSAKSQGNPFTFLVVLFFLVLAGVLFVMNYWVRDPFEAEMASANNVGVNDRIAISFSQPVLVWEKEGIVFSPAVDFLAEISEDRKTLNLYPRKGFSYEENYSIVLNGFKGAGGLSLEQNELVFYTENKPDQREKYGEIEQQYGEITLAQDKYTPPASSLVEEDFVPTAYISEGKYIDVSISHQVMTLFEDGIIINQFLISSGKSGMPTPLGEFAVRKKETNHWSSTYKLWMPYSMNFYGPFYIHELPYWPSGYREGESHLGIKVSHGCIRLGIGPAKYVFDWADIGTPIYIHY